MTRLHLLYAITIKVNVNKADLVILRSVVTGSGGETIAHTCLQDDPLLEKQVVVPPKGLKS